MNRKQFYLQPECLVVEVVSEGILCNSITGEHAGYLPDEDTESYF